MVIIGVSVLALDGARYVSLQTQLQNGVDQLALAAAAALNGAPDSIARAECALKTSLDSFPQSTLFGKGTNQNVTLQPPPSCSSIQVSSQICYLENLPATDNLQIQNCLNPTDPTSSLIARYIRVTVTPVTIPTILPASLFGGANWVTAPATAVAGFSQNVCKFTPMYVCNPFEPVRNADYDLATQLLYENDPADPDAPAHRTMLSLRHDPGRSDNPGNYGFLVSPLTNGFAALIQAVASVQPSACFSQSGVTTQTGFGAQAIANGFNVRFDLYNGSMGGNSNSATYPPARDVRKGYTVTGCNQTQSSPPQAMAMSPDSTPGTWDFDTYWGVEHALPSPAPHPVVTNPVTGITSTWGNTTYLPSRFSVYKYEVAQAANAGGLNDSSQGGEVGHPTCNTNQPPPSVDRRILFTAILNCQALTASGVLGGGKNTDIPVAAFGKFFLIDPIAPSTGDVDAEFVGLVQQSDGVVRNTVQLYR